MFGGEGWQPCVSKRSTSQCKGVTLSFPQERVDGWRKDELNAANNFPGWRQIRKNIWILNFLILASCRNPTLSPLSSNSNTRWIEKELVIQIVISPPSVFGAFDVKFERSRNSAMYAIFSSDNKYTIIYLFMFYLFIWMKLDSMRWFSHRRRTGGRHNCMTYLLTDVVDRAPEDRSRKMPRFVVFCPWWPWPLIPKFELGWDFCTVHITAKFHHPAFNRSEVIMLTNKQTNWQTNIDAAENIHLAPLCYICHMHWRIMYTSWSINMASAKVALLQRTYLNVLTTGLWPFCLKNNNML